MGGKEGAPPAWGSPGLSKEIGLYSQNPQAFSKLSAQRPLLAEDGTDTVL